MRFRDLEDVRETWTHRLPNPKHNSRGSCSALFPSEAIKRSGLKVIGLVYVFESWVNFLVSAEHKHKTLPDLIDKLTRGLE